MKKTLLLSLVLIGFVVAMPSSANALDPHQGSQNLYGETNTLLAQYWRNRNQDRRFSVYYRSPRDRRWTLEGYHPNRQDANRAANRLQRRGFRTYVQVSREVNRRMGR